MQERTREPRSIRLNNPGNIEHSKDRWLGKAPDQPDPRFIKFVSPEYGIRAMVRIWKSYERRDTDGTLTVVDIVSQWAPPHENNTQAYIKNVCAWSGLSKTDAIQMDSVTMLCKLVPAFIRQEAGFCPYSEETILAGVKLGIGNKNEYV